MPQAKRGKRVYLNEANQLILKEGEYGKNEKGIWLARPPGQHTGSLEHHTVKEHEDGTISVSPSILISDGETKWHGYLKRGVWEQC